PVPAERSLRQPLVRPSQELPPLPVRPRFAIDPDPSLGLPLKQRFRGSGPGLYPAGVQYSLSLPIFPSAACQVRSMLSELPLSIVVRDQSAKPLRHTIRPIRSGPRLSELAAPRRAVRSDRQSERSAPGAVRAALFFWRWCFWPIEDGFFPTWTEVPKP